MKIESQWRKDPFSQGLITGHDEGYLILFTFKIMRVFAKYGVNLSFLLFENYHKLNSDDTTQKARLTWFQRFEIINRNQDRKTLYDILSDGSDQMMKEWFSDVASSLSKQLQTLNVEWTVQDIENCQFVKWFDMVPEMAQILYVLNLERETAIEELPRHILIVLDRCGFIWGQSPSTQSYICTILSQTQLLLKMEYYRDKHFPKRMLIPTQHIMEPSIQHAMKDNFGIDGCLWVPGIYSSTSLPISSGGVSISIKNFGVFIQLHSLLSNHTKYYSLDRNELMTHELIHACRENIHSEEYEEEFAYSLSQNRFRKFLAPISRGTHESLLFYLVSFLSITSDLPKFPRWVSLFSKLPVSVVTLLALWRLLRSKQRIARVKNMLVKLLGVDETNANCIAFRLTDQDIASLYEFHSGASQIGALIDEKLNNSQISTRIRWSIIVARFSPKSTINRHSKL